MNKIFTSFILLLILFFSACSKKNIFVSQNQSDTLLKIGMVKTPQLNWVAETEKQDQITALIQRPLVELQLYKGKLQIAPILLEKAEFTSSTSFKLILNKDISWRNNEKVGATQLIQSWKELLLAYPDNANASLLFCINNAKNFAERRVLFSSVGIHANDEWSVEIKFSAPCPNFPFLLSHLSLTPRLNYSWGLAKGNLLPRPLDTLGDWAILMHWPRLEMELERTNHHFDKEATYKLDKLKVTFWKAEKDALQLFEDKQLDIVLGENEGSANISFPQQSFSTVESVVLVFNSYRKPFQSSKVREMFGTALQKEELLHLLGAPVELSHRLLPFLNSTIEPSSFSLSASKKILSETKLTGTLMLATPKDPLLLEVAHNLAAQWKKNLNLDVEVTTALVDNPMMRLQRFRPNFYKKALGLEEWGEFSSGDFLSPVLSNLSSDSSIEPFKLYEDRLSKMEQWVVAEEKLVVPLVTLKKTAFVRSGISALQYKPLADVFDFNSIEKN